MFAVTKYLKIKKQWYLSGYEEYFHRATLKRYFAYAEQLKKGYGIKIEDLTKGVVLLEKRK